MHPSPRLSNDLHSRERWNRKNRSRLIFIVVRLSSESKDKRGTMEEIEVIDLRFNTYTFFFLIRTDTFFLELFIAADC